MHEKLARTLTASRKMPTGLISRLSEREFEVLHLIGLGFSTREIAEKTESEHQDHRRTPGQHQREAGYPERQGADALRHSVDREPIGRSPPTE